MTLSTQDFPQHTPSRRSFPQAIASQLAARIGKDRFELWFSGEGCFGHEGQKILVFADNKFGLMRLQKTFGREIRDTVDRVCGPQFLIEFRLFESASDETVSESDESQTNSEPTPTPIASSPTISIPEKAKLSRPLRRTLSSFWFGNDNRLLKASVDQVFEQPGQFSPFFVHGPTGCGKSHLLDSVTNDFRRKLGLKRCIFLSAEQFTSEFVASLRGGAGLPIFRRKYRDLDLLAIDDIQFLAGKRATLGEFQHTIDNLIRNGKQVVVSSDRPPIELGHLGNDISNRLSGGLTCPINYPDFEGRMKIARNICRSRNLHLPTNVLHLICEQVKRDVRRVSGAINRLHAYSVSIDSKMTPELASRVLADLFAMSGPSCTSLVSIEQAICEICGVQPVELKSKSRKKRISSARMLAMYLSRQYTGSAFSEIGDYFGGRSHSTVIAAERKVAQWLENDEGIQLPHAQCSAKEVMRRLESNLRIS